MKARIAPHGNKDKEKEFLKTDFCTCPPTGIRIFSSIANLSKWSPSNIDFKSAFLQTGNAQRDVNVIQPKECSNRQHYSLLLNASYGLVNADGKWQNEIDFFLTTLGFLQLLYVPQVFYMRVSNSLINLAIKVVDDVLLCTTMTDVPRIIKKIQLKYELGAVFYGPGSFPFFGLQIYQVENFNVSVNGDTKMDAMSCYPITKVRRKEIESTLNEIEISSCRSINTNRGWLGQSVSPFCAFYSSYLQQKLPHVRVKVLIYQINTVKYLQNLETTIQYSRPEEKKEYVVSVLVFADASKKGGNWSTSIRLWIAKL